MFKIPSTIHNPCIYQGLSKHLPAALYRKFGNYILPEMKLRGLFPISIFMYLGAIYIFPQSVLVRPMWELYKSLTDT